MISETWLHFGLLGAAGPRTWTFLKANLCCELELWLTIDTGGSWTDDRGASDRLGSLLDQIYVVCPDAVTLVAQIIGTTYPTVQKRYDAFNAKIPGVVAERVATGKHILVMDMRSINGKYIGPGKNTLLIIYRFWARIQKLLASPKIPFGPGSRLLTLN